MVFEHDYESFPELTNQQISDFGFSSPHIQYTEDFDAVVVKVTDGDTLTLHTSSRNFDFPLRLLDIDAPELGEGGERSKEWLKNRVEGSKVRILINSKNRVGKYGRLIGTVMYNGLSVNDEMIRLGLVSSFEMRLEDQLPNPDKIFSVKQWF